MRQLQITILLILTLIQNVNSQDKVIKGDTAFWYGWNQGLVNKLELTDFREKMLCDKRLRIIHDFQDARDCFPGVEIKGGVNYDI